MKRKNDVLSRAAEEISEGELAKQFNNVACLFIDAHLSRTSNEEITSDSISPT